MSLTLMSFLKVWIKELFLIKALLFKLKVFNLYMVGYQGEKNIANTAWPCKAREKCNGWQKWCNEITTAEMVVKNIILTF